MRHGRFRMQVPERRVRTVRAISPEYEESPSARCQVLVEGLSFALGSGRRSFDDLAWIPPAVPGVGSGVAVKPFGVIKVESSTKSKNFLRLL